MNAAANRGEIKQSVVDEFNKASKGLKLPQKKKKFSKLNKYLGNKDE